MFTESGQAEIVGESLTRFEQGEMLPHVIIDVDGELVGRINLASITRRAFQSAGMGYWVAQKRNGHGIAVAAVDRMLCEAFDAVGLQRVQAETLAHNVASQRVLERNGFVRIGFAPKYLHIADEWRDHVIYQRINDNWAEAHASKPLQT
ncbi:MAG: GNAT family protein [Candidatus Nanopelagicales bacterium]